MTDSLDDEPHTITVARPKPYVRRRGVLEIINGVDAGKRVDFEARVRLGSRRFADVIIPDDRVSGIHCEFALGEDLRVRDLGSKNGTFVGGVRVVEAVLSSGEAVLLGRTRVRVLPVEGLATKPHKAPTEFFGLVGRSPAMLALIEKLETLAGSDSTVLVLGETGSGKERVAEALHLSSPRAKQPLVTVDCGSMPTNLIESELFGFERGAFTGANRTFAGAFERAHGGTLFLDEIGELPVALQPKLLRAIESRSIRRLGGKRAIPVDVRIIAATNRDLQLEVAERRFREDLYYRVAVIPLTVPPLRERLEDLPDLIEHLMRAIGADARTFLTVEAIEELSSHRWPGNVRELRNTLERAANLSMPISIGADLNASQIDLTVSLKIGRQRLVAEYERRYLLAMLEACRGNISEVARRSGAERMTIYRLLRRLQLRPQPDGEDGDDGDDSEP
ncbi:MAG: sigma 54-interacting transcriptional regulator [Polyangia bacterium]